MPLALITLGFLFVVVGFQDTYKEFGAQLAKDFTGQNSFLVWIAAIGIIGAIGYVKELEKFSRMFLLLIFVVMFLSNKGVFDKFNSAIRQGTSSNSGSTVLNSTATQ